MVVSWEMAGIGSESWPVVGYFISGTEYLSSATRKLWY
jgi:hypothetical protein